MSEDEKDPAAEESTPAEEPENAASETPAAGETESASAEEMPAADSTEGETTAETPAEGKATGEASADSDATEGGEGDAEAEEEEIFSQDDLDSLINGAGADGDIKADNLLGQAVDSVTGEVLDQSGIDNLMANAQDEKEITIFRANGKRVKGSEKVYVQVYDFRNPVFLTEVELRQVRIRHEKFIHYLAARLSMFLNMDFGLKMSKLYTSPYIKFIESIPNPTYINLFKIEQLTGVGIIDTSPRLAMTIVNRMLGGQGHSIQEERYLTEIEMGLMDDLIAIILDEWGRQWEEVTEMDISLVGNENNGRFLQTAPHDAIMLIVDMEATLGDCSAQMQLAVPYYMIEPIIREMQAKSRRYSRIGSVERASNWLDGYNKIDVPIYAEWDAFSASVKDLLSIREGDVIQLPRSILKSTKLRCKNVTHFVGEVGVEEEKVAVKIVEKLK